MKRRGFLKILASLPALPLLAKAEALPNIVKVPEPEKESFLAELVFVDGNGWAGATAEKETLIEAIKACSKTLDGANVPRDGREIRFPEDYSFMPFLDNDVYQVGDTVVVTKPPAFQIGYYADGTVSSRNQMKPEHEYYLIEGWLDEGTAIVRKIHEDWPLVEHEPGWKLAETIDRDIFNGLIGNKHG